MALYWRPGFTEPPNYRVGGHEFEFRVLGTSVNPVSQGQLPKLLPNYTASHKKETPNHQTLTDYYFFHCQILYETYNKAIIKNPVTPYTSRYTAL